MKDKTNNCQLPIVIVLAAMLAGCASQKREAYLMDAPRDVAMPVEKSYSLRIFPGDRLYIYVYSQTPESATPFNEETNRTQYSVQTVVNNQQEYKPVGHLVGSDGTMLFPILGSLNTTGLSTSELAHEIERRLKDGNYVKDAIVSVSLMNFRATVIGEVAHPQQLHADGDRLTILEAIARCGDVTMDGMRNCVMVVRTTDGRETVDTVDLTSRSLLEGPYYYLQQNDIVYVCPTKKKQRRAYRNEDWPIYLNTGVQAVRFAYTTIYRYLFNPRVREAIEESQK